MTLHEITIFSPMKGFNSFGKIKIKMAQHKALTIKETFECNKLKVLFLPGIKMCFDQITGLFLHFQALLS